MQLKIALLVMLAAIVLPCAAQNAPAKPAAPVPDAVLYQAFLFRVAWIDEIADKKAAQGEKDAVIRSTIRRQAGLTGPEDAALRSIAKEWKKKNEAIVASAAALFKAGAKSDTPALQTLTAQRQDAILGSISQLQVRFSALRYQRLDAFIRSTEKITAVPVRTGPIKARQ